MKLDVNHALRAAAYHASLDLRGAPTRLLGAWHVHPSVGSTKPSVTDRRGSGLRLEERDLNPARFALDLIISPHKDRGWFAPEYTAWTTQRNVFGSLVTEPVTIERPRR